MVQGEHPVTGKHTIFSTRLTRPKFENALVTRRKLSASSPHDTGLQMQSIAPKHLEDLFSKLKVLVVDDDHYMRKVVRTMLTVIGVRQIHEAVDGTSGLNAIREIGPDLVLVDWEMPTIDGMQFVRLVRWPGGACPVPDVPIIMLTGHGDRWRVVEAARLGVHEYLLKPVSTKALLDRLVSIFSKPRPIVKGGGYYGPAPRKVVPIPDEKAVSAARHDVVILN